MLPRGKPFVLYIRTKISRIYFFILSKEVTEAVAAISWTNTFFALGRVQLQV